MSTSTRQAYRPSYQPAAGAYDVSRPAGRCDCGQEVTVEELFTHDCPNDIRAMRQAVRTIEGIPATGQRDSLDVPEWRGGAGGHSPARRRGPSPKQVDWLLDLYAKAGEDAAERVAELRDGNHASAEITRLRALIARRNAEQPAPPRENGCKPNRYSGDCRFCGGAVPAGEGLLCRVDDRWAVEHKAGECRPAQGHTAANAGTLADVAEGHYAIESTGHNDLAFYRVDRPTEGDYAGRTFVKLIVGGKPDRNMPRSHVAGILERIAADPREASRRYAAEIRRCARCNRQLTDEASRRDADVNGGYGPECVKHV